MKLSTSKIASLTLALAGYAQSTAILVSYNAYTIYEANPHQELWLVGDPPPTTCGVKIAQMCEISNTGASCSVDGSAGTYTGTITAENTNGCNNGENVVGGTITTPSGEVVDVTTDSRCQPWTCCQDEYVGNGIQCDI